MSAPERIGRYRTDRLVGSGGFATVWLARDEVLDAPVAVKVLADNWAHQLDVRERFLEEARILRRADSDRVVRVHDIGELDDGRPYFVMTYADGGTLADKVAAGPVPVADALRYGADVARGLAVLHEVGVIHRDVNPANVLLRSGRNGGSDRVLVADLGLAKAAAHGSGFTLTVGTAGYMAPEQSSGDAISKRADVYAVGALLHHLLTGEAPTADGLPELPADLPEPVRAVARQAVRRRPEERFPSATALADALDDARIAVDALPRRAPVRVAAAADDEATERIAHPAPAVDPASAPDDTMPLRRPIAVRVDEAETDTRPGTASEPGTAPLEPPRRRRRWPVLLTVLLVALAGGAGGYVSWGLWFSPTVQVGGDEVSVTVPRPWAAQRQEGPRAGLRVLLVSRDVSSWNAASDTPAVWVGVGAADLPEDALPESPAKGCRPSPGSPPGPLSGTVTHYRSCGKVGGTDYTEAVLHAPDGRVVVVQIKGDAATADQVLASLTLR